MYYLECFTKSKPLSSLSTITTFFFSAWISLMRWNSGILPSKSAPSKLLTNYILCRMTSRVAVQSSYEQWDPTCIFLFSIWFANVFNLILLPFLLIKSTLVSITLSWITFMAFRSFSREWPTKIVSLSIILPKSSCKLFIFLVTLRRISSVMPLNWVI